MGLEEFKSQRPLNAAAGVESSHGKMGRVGGLSQEPMGLRQGLYVGRAAFPNLFVISSNKE